jgi:UDP-2,3-diacylglucosamine pyrophosphatase LpxH
MVNNILNKAFKKAKRVNLTYDAKLIFFSDLHKGDNSYSDDFRNNYKVYKHALQSYFDQGYTYVELGDGIELWENRTFEPIYKVHKPIFELLKRFHEQKRLFLVWGNHDMEFRNPIKVEQILRTFFTPRNIEDKNLYFDLEYYESLLFEFEDSAKCIFALHGHQADYMNYVHWKFNRFFVRYFWKYLQKWFGISDPTSPAKNYKGLIKVERKLNQWIVKNNNQMIICGHTHRPRFPDPGDIPLFNDGSCVHPKSIIGIEIEDFKISLIKWHYTLNQKQERLIVKTYLEGPEILSKYM